MQQSECPQEQQKQQPQELRDLSSFLPFLMPESLLLGRFLIYLQLQLQLQMTMTTILQMLFENEKDLVYLTYLIMK